MEIDCAFTNWMKGSFFDRSVSFIYIVPFTSTLITKKAILSDFDSVMPKLVYVPAAYHNMTNKGNAIFSYLVGNAYIT